MTTDLIMRFFVRTATTHNDKPFLGVGRYCEHKKNDNCGVLAFRCESTSGEDKSSRDKNEGACRSGEGGKESAS